MPKKKQEKWQLLRHDNISYANIKRSRVQGLILKGPLNRSELLLAGHEALAFAATYMPDVQGIALFLWTDRKKVGKEEAVASVHWCPHGHWEWLGQYPVTDNIFEVEFDRQSEEESDAERSIST